MVFSLGHYAHASETQDYLIQRAYDLCGHEGEVTYEQCITEDGSRLAADPDFFALIKKMCGADTQLRKCLKDAFVEATPSEGSGSEDSYTQETAVESEAPVQSAQNFAVANPEAPSAKEETGIASGSTLSVNANFQSVQTVLQTGKNDDAPTPALQRVQGIVSTVATAKGVATSTESSTIQSIYDIGTASQPAKPYLNAGTLGVSSVSSASSIPSTNSVPLNSKGAAQAAANTAYSYGAISQK